MPKVRGNKKAFLERQKDSKGLLCKSVTAHLNDWEDITADNETQTQNVTRTIADILNDKTIKSNRPFFYKGTSRTTLWRNRQAAEAVNKKDTLHNYFTAVDQINSTVKSLN